MVVDGICFVKSQYSEDIGVILDEFAEYCCGILEKEAGGGIGDRLGGRAYFAVLIDNCNLARSWAKLLRHRLISRTSGIEKDWDVISVSDVNRLKGLNVLGAIVVGNNIHDDDVVEIKIRIRSRLGK